MPWRKDDALIESGGTPLPELDGRIKNNATNNPDLWQGDFTGTLIDDDDGIGVIADGVGCNWKHAPRRADLPPRILIQTSP